ncbi:MAG: cytochrome b/b6 domain-containing protein [Gammaproteobacteria bacterium]
MKSITVWPYSARVIHLLLVAMVSFQFFSAWALGQGAGDPNFWLDWHVMLGQGLLFVLGARLYLLSGKGVLGWRALVLDRAARRGAVEMGKFYLSMGRMPLPAWFAHNPAWRPLYVLMLVLLVAAVLTGFGHDSYWRVAGFRISELHTAATSLLAIVLVGHVAAAVWHDWKGHVGGISGILGGDRCFEDKQPGQTGGLPFGSIQVPFDTTPKKKD